MDEAANMIDMERVDISVLVGNIINEVSLELEEKHISIVDSLKKGIQIKGNYSLLYSIFRNLMDNAIAYAGTNIQININCFREDENYYYFSFADTGIGVSPEHLNRLFERFYRVDKGRSRKLGGTGLGLAIVKNAVIIHGGNISAKNNQGGGLEFVFTLAKRNKQLGFSLFTVQSNNQPISQIPFPGIKGHTDFHQSSAIHSVGQKVTFFINLLQSFFGGAGEFKFEHIDVVRSLYYCVGTTDSGTDFRLRELPHEFEDEIEYNLIMTFRFLVQFVRKIGEETGQTSEESFRFARFQFMHKFPDIKGGIGGCDRSIERGDKIEETIFHLFVRKP